MNQNTNTATDAVTDSLAIGEWIFHARLNRLECGEKTVKLEPRVARLLDCLAKRAGFPVSRDTLMNEVWPGMVVGDEALTNAVNKLRKAFEDDRQNPEVIETIPKSGYRLIARVAPVEASASLSDVSVDPVNPGPVTRFRRNRRVLASALLLLAITVFTPLFITNDREAESDSKSVHTGKPSIAVLPFDNIADNKDEDYFADGITDDIITELARNPQLLVIARDSTFFYKGKSIDIRALADRLKVRYLLRGSVRRVDDTVRINARLVDTRDESLLWAERYDGSLSEIFALQDRITRQIAASLSAKFEPADTPVPPITQNLDAYDKFTFGRTRFYLYANKEENLSAREFFQAAVDLDPNFAPAYAMLAWTYTFEAINGWVDDREPALHKGIELAERAISLDRKQPIAYFVRGLAYREKQDYIKAMVDAEKAIEIDPNYANGYMLLSSLYYFAGRPREGLELIRRSMRLHPHHPYNYSLHLGQVYFVLRQYDDAIDALTQAVSSHPSSERLHVWLAASHAYAGNIDEAGWEVDQILTINPDFSLDNVRKTYPFKDDADRYHFIEGLRMAGL